jgi:hypothetical protein
MQQCLEELQLQIATGYAAGESMDAENDQASEEVTAGMDDEEGLEAEVEAEGEEAEEGLEMHSAESSSED